MAVKGVAMMGDGRRWHGHTPWILSLQRNVAVLALRLLDPLGLEHAQSLDQLGAGRAAEAQARQHSAVGTGSRGCGRASAYHLPSWRHPSPPSRTGSPRTPLPPGN